MTASITVRAAKGRAPSCTKTMRQSARTAARPAATESAGSAPPAISVNVSPGCRARKAGGLTAAAAGRTGTGGDTARGEDEHEVPHLRTGRERPDRRETKGHARHGVVLLGRSAAQPAAPTGGDDD